MTLQIRKRAKRLHQITMVDMILMLIMSIIIIVMLVPILNIFAKAFSSPELAHTVKGYNILPKGFSTIFFQVILKNPIIGRSILNSLFITIVGTTVNLMLTSATAYALIQPRLVGKKLFMFFLVVMMVFEPGIVQIHFVISRLGLLDHLMAIVLVNAMNVYYLIILMRFFQGIPPSLGEAAEIDGANHFVKLFRIYLPLAKMPMMTVGMFYLVARWNEFFKSGVLLSSRTNTVLQVLLRQFVVQDDTVAIISEAELLVNSAVAQLDTGAIKSATIVIAMLPILLLYPLILKHYASGVLSGAVKE